MGFSIKDTIYFIMVDRFNNDKCRLTNHDSCGFQGGSIPGIIEKLNYIKDLGVTAIWITPVFKNQEGCYHGYSPIDFFQVDERFGTMDDLKELVEKAHALDIKVILDMVLNHTAKAHPWVTMPEYKDWFHEYMPITDWNDWYQLEHGTLFDLPDLAQENPEVSKYLIDMSIWWIDQTKVDGFRLDALKHISMNFWEDFSDAIKRKYPDFFLIGEAWHNDPVYLSSYQRQGGIDSLLDYSLFGNLINCFGFGKSPRELYETINCKGIFKNPELNCTFIDNHDNPRFITTAGTDGQKKLKLALTFLLTYPQIPIIYYGTEVAMEGDNDPHCRKNMEWDKTDNHDILIHFKKLTSIKNTQPEISTGDFKIIHIDDRTLVYLRLLDHQISCIALNVSNESVHLNLNLNHHLQDISVKDCREILQNNKIEIIDNTLNMVLEPMESKIIKLK